MKLSERLQTHLCDILQPDVVPLIQELERKAEAWDALKAYAERVVKASQCVEITSGLKPGTWNIERTGFNNYKPECASLEEAALKAMVNTYGVNHG